MRSESPRDQAARLVADWYLAYEQLGAGRSKHPLEQIRELQLAGRRSARPQGRRSGGSILGLTARASSSHSTAPGSTVPIVDLPPRIEEAFKIMRHLLNTDMDCWKTLVLGCQGVSLRQQARLRGVSKSLIQEWKRAGLAVVTALLIGGWFR